MKTFASLFSGGGGADIGAISAGLNPIWGVEYVPEIAEWYGVNIGHPAIVKSVLTVNFSELESPFWLHASPPCVTASVANAKAGESLMDAALAAAVCEAIDELLPEWFSLENVGGYRSYASYAAIRETLVDNGYKLVDGVLNSADYGVPQTRRRLFLVASRTAAPVMPPPTHSDKEAERMQLSMFDAPLKPWVGWYEAIADLLPGCPDSKLAEWQLKRLPAELVRPVLAFEQNGARPPTLREYNQPSTTNITDVRLKAVLINESSSMECNDADGSSASLVASERSLNTKALLIDGKMNAYGTSVTAPSGDDPAFTTVAQNTTRQPLSAVLVHASGGDPLKANAPGDPSHVIVGSEKTVAPRAVLYPPNFRTWEIDTPPLAADKPAYTLSATINNKTASPTVTDGYTVKRLTPRCLFRLQGVPDTYRIPDDRRLAGRIAGNMVCPPVEAAIIKAQGI
jgi:DNA-cytosine methyltransferase